MVISEAQLAVRSKGLIWGIVGASVIVLVVSALVSGILLPGLLVAAGIVAFTWVIVQMTVSIAIAEEKIVLGRAPFYSIEVSNPDVLAVTMAENTSLSDGYGFRVMGKGKGKGKGKGTRGLLAGGPAVALETKTRRWIVSTAHSEEVVSTIQDQSAGNPWHEEP
ncbi:hypothetical protein BMF89_05480 [Arthrobacter sp. SRS-W-1-2016]|uniref:hypothetical protein n=1 Tax=Arthrobacter sp. SRS-W-1-2016 TaxID=1930254 RepID=UPI0009913F00|nr:hypothetical protein [Arthrobacter sp. SRS-W-1-2016]OOP63731.1 hypothetical protein BMF89_05480 [Arthrobacter sp. SRS-W-1-2016]